MMRKSQARLSSSFLLGWGFSADEGLPSSELRHPGRPCTSDTPGFLWRVAKLSPPGPIP